MRELKFRAWDNKKSEFVDEGEIRYCFYGDTKLEVLPNSLSYSHDYDAQENCNVLNGRFIVMQYTGLKDKNGKEIWEGDVCVYNSGVSKSEELVFSVSWDESKARFAEHLSMIMSDGSFLRSINKVEVIGNIYQNPELI